ncbi:MAG: nucleoside deaminase [Paludibacteraceae bacterium]|nr:nucleoside deaminase [Paludibacteraceae bacterium]
MECDDIRFMKLALDEAQKAYNADEVPIGAVITLDGQIVGRGHNLTERLADVTAHAEIQAITAAAATLGSKYLEGCTVYVTVEPCVMCAGAMYWAKIARLVYGAPDEKYGYSKIAPDALHPKTIVESGVLAEKCADLMKDFFKNKRL